ncbi:MAG: protein kinase [Verrucomicrobiae bacterium]|nr:protein kinase [Verrucomicrobiae bacterium]
MNTEKCNQNRCPRCGMAIPPESPAGLCPKCLLSEAQAATDSPQGIATDDVPPIEKIRSAFPQLEIVELIGRGGMGFVYKARQPHLDRYVALKILPDKLARDPLFAERFNREGRVLAKLSHPNIVAIYDFGQAGEFYYLLMEYVDGVNLRQAMNLGRFSPSEALKIVPKICEALQYAHEHGILHRDIKPENILIDAHGNVKITDFGIAKLVGDQQKEITLTGTGVALGTPHYMAPEQIESPTKVDQRADIYSLGVVFYEMLTGELPLGRFEPPSARTPVPKEVDEVVFKSLEKDKEKRFKSAQEVKTKVEHIGEAKLSEKDDGAKTISQIQSSGEKQKISAYAVASATLTGLGILFFLAFIVVIGSKGTNMVAIALTLLPAALFCCVGTVLGWIGLSKMRAEPGRWIGQPLAMFGALSFPVTIMFFLFVGAPYAMVVAHEPSVFINIVALALPCLMIAFSTLIAMKTLAWVKGQERISPNSKRSVLISSIMLFCFLVAMRFLFGGGKHSESQAPVRPSLFMSAGISPLRLGGEPLPDGIVEVIGISDNSNPHLWWSADGKKQVYPEINRDSGNLGVGKDEREFNIAFKVGKLDKFAGMTFICPGAHGHGFAVPNSIDGNFTNVLRVAYPQKIREATVYVGVAYGDWDTVARTGPTEFNPSWVTYRDGERWRIQFLGAIEDKEGNINISFSYNIPVTDFYTWRVVAATDDGAEHKAQRFTSLPGNYKAIFKRELAGKIKEYRIQVLKYRWASFDVALYPESGNVGK